MKARLLLLFGFGLAEMFLLAWVTAETSLLVTLALVLGSAFIGSALLRHQGAAVWRRAVTQATSGGSPGEPVMDGVLILIAAGLFIIPGILSDALGLLLLIPTIRRLIRPHLAGYFGRRMSFQTVGAAWGERGHRDGNTDPDNDEIGDGEIIDADFRPTDSEKLTSRG